MAAPLERAERRRILRVWKDNPNWNISQIARATGYTTRMVRCVFADLRARREGGKSASRPEIAERNNEIRRLWQTQRHSATQIANRHGISRQRAHKIAKGAGL